jgi:D-amino-acid dehydrogenase
MGRPGKISGDATGLYDCAGDFERVCQAGVPACKLHERSKRRFAVALTKVDVIVLGAGAVGVSAALHLQARGRSVVIVDRLGEAASETSYGNAGLIQSEAVFPYMFPRDPLEMTRGALNRDPRAQTRYSALGSVGPWIWRYFLASTPKTRQEGAKALRPLTARSVVEHEALAAAAGTSALLRKGGWIKTFRTERTRQAALAEVEELKPWNVGSTVLDRAQLANLEPHLTETALGGVHFTDPSSTSDPGALVKSYAELFLARGGRLLAGDARTLEQSGAAWTVAAGDGRVQAPDVVIALGPWSSDVFRALGYDIPLGVKRGYHMHFGAEGNATLNHAVMDADFGYVLAPQTRGIRLTTGAEFAGRDDEPSPAHFDRIEPRARELFPLAERRDAELWLGRRPCLPDMLPVIGAAPRHKGLWFDFGHQHLGLTLGPVTGLLLAQLMTGETPLTDPAPYRAERFG